MPYRTVHTYARTIYHRMVSLWLQLRPFVSSSVWHHRHCVKRAKRIVIILSLPVYYSCFPWINRRYEVQTRSS